MADLIVYPVGRYVLDPAKPSLPDEVLAAKEYIGAGSLRGLKVLRKQKAPTFAGASCRPGIPSPKPDAQITPLFDLRQVACGLDAAIP